MNKDKILKIIAEVKQQDKRKFTQSFDLIINLKNINVKSNPVDFFVTLPYPKGRKVKVAAFVGPELEAQAKEHCDLVITTSDFASYDKAKSKKLAQEYDYFISQATIMPKVAAAFGRVLGTRGKMPNPKIGCVVPPNANLSPLIERLSKTIKMSAKKATNLQCLVGKEDMGDDQVAENILTAYNMTVKNLPNETQNIKKALLKLTMGKPVVL